MILDNIQNIGRYKGLHAALDEALDYIMACGLAGLAPGRHEVDGERIYLLVQEPALKSFEETAWEAHRLYIDIQIALKDGETIGYAPIDLVDGWSAYDAQKDIRFSHSPFHGLALPLPAGAFAVFFPHDAHRPVIGAGTTRKAVMKVLA